MTKGGATTSTEAVGTGAVANWSPADKASCIDRLFTLRDWLRFGISRFAADDLVYGHGTASALDEAAFLILSHLNLPIDQLEPWLEARVTPAEAAGLYDLFAARVTTRKPAPYLVGAAYIQGYRFEIDERVIIPRSFLGELLAGGLEGVIDDPWGIERVLDVCTGSGCLAIIAADQFASAHVIGSDVSADALDVARRNVAAYGIEARVQIVKSDLLADVPSDPRFDLIVSNPPYVRDSAVDAFPPEYAFEPRLAHAGGADGLDLVHRILAEAPRFLTDRGMLVVEVGQERETLEACYPELPFLWLDTEDSSGEVFALSAGDLTTT